MTVNNINNDEIYDERIMDGTGKSNVTNFCVKRKKIMAFLKKVIKMHLKKKKKLKDGIIQAEQRYQNRS